VIAGQEGANMCSGHLKMFVNGQPADVASNPEREFNLKLEKCRKNEIYFLKEGMRSDYR
jgi:hypothetical protein